MMNGMANHRKAKKLNAELKMLDGQELDHIEQQVKSLLAIQNTTSGKTHQSRKKTKDAPIN